MRFLAVALTLLISQSAFAGESELKLTSPNGKYSIMLTATDYGAFVVTQAEDGRVAELTTNKHDSGFQLFDEKMKALCSVGAVKSKKAGVFIWAGKRVNNLVTQKCCASKCCSCKCCK